MSPARCDALSNEGGNICATSFNRSIPHCEHCDGELLFKSIERDDPEFDFEVQIFSCAKRGREHSRKLVHEPYIAHRKGRGAEGWPNQWFWLKLKLLIRDKYLTRIRRMFLF